MKLKYIISIALIAILGFAVYANSLDGQFIWDDELLIKDNTYIKDWSSTTKIFGKDTGISSRTTRGGKYSLYRPLQIFSYMLDYSRWKFNVEGYHLSNIILHILAALVIFWLINTLYNNRLLSFLTGLLFVVHPIHTGAVSYISGRADPLVSIFILLCFIFYVKFLRIKRTTFYILMLLCYTLALLSRENSLILPALLLLYHYSFKEKLEVKTFLPIMILTSVYSLLRCTLLSFLLPEASTALFQRIPGFFVALTNYTRLLFLPFNLHMEYGDKLFNLTNPQAILGIVICLALFIGILSQTKNRSQVFFSLSWFFIALLPSSNLYPINAYMAEHWLYLPSIGFFLILAHGLNYLYKTKKLQAITIILVIFLLTFYSYLTIRQNNYWREPLSFYQRTLQYASDSPRLHNNLGNVYHEQGKNEEAIAAYKKAIAIDPTYANAYNNLGFTYQKLNNTEEAIALYKKAIQIKPNFANAHYNLGNAYYDLGKNEEAVASYKKSIEINPNRADPYNNLGNVYLNLGQSKQAITWFKKAIQVDPDYIKAYNNLGNAYRHLGKSEEAIASYREAIKLNPDYATAYYNLGNVYYDLGQTEQAIASFKKAIQIDPHLAEAYNTLAIVYFRQEQYRLAIEYGDRAQELGFNNPALFDALKTYRQ